MLHCPPSRISLSHADVEDLSERLAERHRKQGATRQKAVQGYGIKTTIVLTANQTLVRDTSNATQKMAQSSSANTIVAEAVQAAVAAMQQRQQQRDSPTQVQRSPGYSSLIQPFEPVINPASDTPTRTRHSRHKSKQQVAETPIRQVHFHGGREVFAEIEDGHDRHASIPVGHTPLLSSVRARRPRRRSQDETTNVYEQSLDVRHVRLPDKVDDIQDVSRLSEILSMIQKKPSTPFNPEAPVFMPRIFYAHITTSPRAGLESPTSSLSASETNQSDRPLELRTLTRSERNQEIDRARTRPAQGISYADSLRRHARAVHSVSAVEVNNNRDQRLRHSSDLLDSFPAATRTLERYPMIGPPMQSRQRRQSTPSSQRQPTSFSNRSGNITTGVDLGCDDSARGTERSTTSKDAVRGAHTTPTARSPSSSPADSPISFRRPPPCTQFPPRSSSLAGSQAASEVTTPYQPKRYSVFPDAVEEFSCQRSSPLDRLIEDLEEMMLTAPRASRSAKCQASADSSGTLLNGDPFQLDDSDVPSPCLRGRTNDKHPDSDAGPTETEHTRDFRQRLQNLHPIPNNTLSTPSIFRADTPTLTATERLNLQFEAAVRQRALRQGSSEIPSTPPRPTSSATASTASSLPAAAASPVRATPRVSVYNDSLPPHTQPQTPADIDGSSRRARNHSDLFAHRGTPLMRWNSVASPPHSFHRNTIWTHRSAFHQAEYGGMVSPTTQIPGRRNRSRRGNEPVENDAETHLEGMQEDRRLWLSRRDQNLDITPPREGRFEQFLD